MASTNRKKRHWVSMLTLLDESNLHQLKVKITRMNIPEPATQSPLLTDIDDPVIVAKLVHYRTDKEPRPIFSREGIIVNQEDIIEERVISTGHDEDKRTDNSRSHSPKSNIGRFSERNKSPSTFKKPVRRSRSPIPHSSKSYPSGSRDSDYYSGKEKGRRSRSKSYEKQFQRNSPTRRKLSRTPPRYDRKSRSPRDYRSNKSPPRYKSGQEKTRSPIRGKGRASRSPGRENTRYGSRSPPSKHKVNQERRRHSRSPESREVRSSSHSPYRVRRSRSRERRYSRSPHRRDPRRSKRSPRNSYRYSPEHRSRRSRSPKLPPHDRDVARLQDFQYYKGDEYWFPGAMQPRFLPPGFMPPGAFPRLPGPVLMPRMPMMIPPRGPYRPRLPVYNRPKVKVAAPAVKSSTETTASSTVASSTVTVSSPTTSIQDVGNNVVSSCDLNQQNSEHSSQNVDNNKEVHED